MRHLVRKNRSEFIRLLGCLEVTKAEGQSISFEEGVEFCVASVIDMDNKDGKIMFVGNGGSAAMASHMATDFLKNVGVAAVCFNDGSLLTCLSNDLGYEHVFARPIEKIAKDNDILVAISSSGQSANILKAVRAAKKKNLKVITLTGFCRDNPLRREGIINFYVPSDNYGHVEDIHHSICHCWIDIFIQDKGLITEKERVGVHE